MKKITLKEEPVFKLPSISTEERLYKALQDAGKPLTAQDMSAVTGRLTGGNTYTALRILVDRKLIKKEQCPICHKADVYSLVTPKS